MYEDVFLSWRWWFLVQLIYIDNLETTALCHFTDQTTEAAISKFCLGVLNSIRTKKGINKSVLIKAFI